LTLCPFLVGGKMAKIICTDGTEEYLSPGEARAKVARGEAVFAQGVPTYSTRHMVAAKPEVKKRKRRTKAEIEADEAAAQVDADETE
jgi:hypothetical protein